MNLIDNDFYLYEVAEEELPPQIEDDDVEENEEDSFSTSYSYRDSSEDSWDEEGCEEGYFLYGKLNKEVEKRNYTGASTYTADTLVDDFTSTISVNVKYSPKDLDIAYIDQKTNEIVFIARDGSEISRTPLSPFIQEQSDLGETDPNSETFVKGKKTSSLENDGPPGQDPSLPPDKYVTQSYTTQLSTDINNHIKDYNNPHKTTAEQLGAVPVDFRAFQSVTGVNKNFRQSADVFVGNNGSGFRMTLQDVKNMGTKIVSVNNVKEADFDKLDAGDYIYSKI